MAGRSGTTFSKRQKELARKEKQREKMERRHQRKQERDANADDGNSNLAQEETAPQKDDDLGAQ